MKVLDESSKTTVEENQRLVISVDELESRLQALEAKIALTEASMTKEVSLLWTSSLVIVMFVHLIFANLQLNIYICSEIAWTEVPFWLSLSFIAFFL